MPRRVRRCLAVLFALLALVVVVKEPLAKRVRAVALLSSLAQPPEHGAALIEEDVSISGRTGPIRARVYRRADRVRAPGLVLAHGVHWQGIDEKRLVPFARELARAGRVVLTPELSDLTDYRITARGADTVADAVSWLSMQRERVTSPKVGVLGFSFAGGLSLVAASRPELRGKVEFVTSVGGHHDLSRVLRFLLSDQVETPSGTRHVQAHEYGLVVLVYGNLDHFVDEPDRGVMRDALRHWLHEDRAQALASASFRKTLSGERLYGLLESSRLRELSPQLEDILAAHRGALAELSPRGRLADIPAPVYLLHGSADSVIPPSETQWGELELGTHDHQALVSPLLEHVEVSRSAGIGEEIALVDFMSRML
jgi:dienelactone hydrolase